MKTKPATNRILLAVFCLFTAISTGQSVGAAELSGAPEELRDYLQSDTRTVTIRDDAVEVAYSDIAKVTLTVSTEAKQLAIAMQENNELRQSVIDELIASGIKSEDIRSSKYSASPQFGWFRNTPSSFEIINSLVVTVDNETAFRRVAEISDQKKSVRFTGVEFEHSEKESYEDKVRDKAVDAVLNDRDYFAGKLGLTLTPISFTFSDVRFAERDRFGDIEEMVATGQKAMSSSYIKPAAPSSFDEIEYRVTVAVIFEVNRPEQ